MAVENQSNNIAANNAKRGQFDTRDRNTFALTLAGLASTDGVDIDDVLKAAATPPPTNIDDAESFTLDLQQARYLAQEHQNASTLIEGMVANGTPRDVATAEISAVIPEYEQVKNALMATETSYEVRTQSTLDAEVAASSLGSNMVYAYEHGNGVAASNSLLSNSTMSIDIIQDMPPIMPQVSVEQDVPKVEVDVAPIEISPSVVSENPAQVTRDTVRQTFNQDYIDRTRETEVLSTINKDDWEERGENDAQLVQQQEANRIAENTQTIEVLMREKMAENPAMTPAEAAAGVALDRADLHREITHIPQEEFNLAAGNIQADIEKEQGITQSGDAITTAQLLEMQKDASLSLSELDLNTATTEARLVSKDINNTTKTGQAEAATILFNASNNKPLLEEITRTEGLVVLNDRDGNGVKIDSNGDGKIDDSDITLHITDPSLQNSIKNSLIGATQLEALIAAAKESGAKEIHLNVGPDGIADPNDPVLADRVAEIRREAKATDSIEVEQAEEPNPLADAMKGVTLEGFNGNTVAFAVVDGVGPAIQQRSEENLEKGGTSLA